MMGAPGMTPSHSILNHRFVDHQSSILTPWATVLLVFSHIIAAYNSLYVDFKWKGDLLIQSVSPDLSGAKGLQILLFLILTCFFCKLFFILFEDAVKNEGIISCHYAYQMTGNFKEIMVPCQLIYLELIFKGI